MGRGKIECETKSEKKNIFTWEVTQGEESKVFQPSRR